MGTRDLRTTTAAATNSQKPHSGLLRLVRHPLCLDGLRGAVPVLGDELMRGCVARNTLGLCGYELSWSVSTACW